MKFYNSPNFDYATYIDRRSVSLITPSIFQEHVLRLFVRDPSKIALAERAFQRFARETLGAEIRKNKEQAGKGAGLSQNALFVGESQ